MSNHPSRFQSFLHELRRRRVFRLVLVYTGVAFVLLQVADLILPGLMAPDWVFRVLVVLAILGLPLAVALAWVFDVTPAGIKRTASPNDTNGGAPAATATPAVPEPARDYRSIAVLPFVNMSSDPENEYFSDGMTEEILDMLAKVGELRVPARTSCFAFKGRNADVREVGRMLDVQHVVEGSVRKSGQQLRITAQLINAEDGYHLWSDSYDRELKDVFAIQEDIARRIVEALRITLTERERRAIAKVPTRDLAAYDQYLRGRQFLDSMARTTIELSRKMFRSAVEKDPSFALAHADLAKCCGLLYMYWAHTDDNLAEADASSLRALEIDADMAEVRAARGYILSLKKEYDEAERHFERAQALDPKSFDAFYFHARACFAQGKLEEAARLFEAAARVRPDDYQAVSLVIGVYRGLGRRAEEQEATRRAGSVLERHLALHPDDVRALYMAANRMADLGNADRARAYAAEVLKRDPTDPASLYNIACAYAKLGDVEPALDTLHRALDHGFAHREWIENDTDLDLLRSHPRYHSLLERLDAR